MLTLHAVWSVATPISLVEALFGDRALTPWLGRAGLVVTGLLFPFGAVATTAITLHGDAFVASASQFACSGIVCVVLTVVAFGLRRRSTAARAAGWVPTFWLVGAGALGPVAPLLIAARRPRIGAREG